MSTIRAPRELLKKLPRPLRSGLNENLRLLLGPLNFERLQFWRRLDYWPHLLEPRSFNEKLSAQKLFADLPLAHLVADKIAVRDYVASKVGAEYLNPALQVVDDAVDIDFDALPEAFVARTTHGSSLNLLVADRSDFDAESARRQLDGYLKRRFGWLTNEWWYQQIAPRVIVEPLLRDARFGTAVEFNLFVFHGRVRFLRGVEKATSSMRDFYDRDWNILPFYFPDLPRGASAVAAPARLGEMIEIAETLSAGFDFLRVDLYCLNDDRIVFSELTIAPGAGWHPMEPRSAAFKIGSYWDIGWTTERIRPEIFALARR